jgi:hypothetical protein
MLGMSKVLAVSVALIAIACHRSNSLESGALDSSPASRSIVWIAEEAGPLGDAGRKTNTEHYRCAKDWQAGDYVARIEKHDNISWFCSRWIELETTASLTILDSSPGPMEEIKRWTLLVDGVRLNVRIDPNWSNLISEGWNESEIESVVYPETFGRSARRISGGTVRRETDLILFNAPGLRIHFDYSAKSIDVSAIDTMIDRAHVPICERKQGCEFCDVQGMSR